MPQDVTALISKLRCVCVQDECQVCFLYHYDVFDYFEWLNLHSIWDVRWMIYVIICQVANVINLKYFNSRTEKILV